MLTVCLGVCSWSLADTWSGVGATVSRARVIGKLMRRMWLADNPDSDVAGANAAGWRSVLVETGVYTADGRGGRPARHRATHEARDVAEAVEWVLADAGDAHSAAGGQQQQARVAGGRRVDHSGTPDSGEGR